MTRRVNKDGGLSESAWQSQVMGLLTFYGWRAHHAPDNKPVAVQTAEGLKRARGRAGLTSVGDKGFPDVVATRRILGYGRELVVAELKTDTGRMGPGQEEWLAAWRELAAGIGVLEKRLGDLGYWDDAAPAVGVYVWRPRDREEVERVLAGPDGAGVMVERVEAVRGQVDP